MEEFDWLMSGLDDRAGALAFAAGLEPPLDDHPRNHAIVAQGRRWRLGPAYDLTPTPIPGPARRDLPMICGPSGRWANRKNLIGSPGRFLLSRAGAEVISDRVAATIRSSWHAVMRESGVSQRGCDLIRPAILYDGLFTLEKGEDGRPDLTRALTPSDASLDAAGAGVRDDRDGAGGCLDGGEVRGATGGHAWDVIGRRLAPAR